jgi:ribosomal protein L40E
MSLDSQSCRSCSKVIHQVEDGRLKWFTVCTHCGATDPYRTKRQTLIPLGIGLAIVLFVWITTLMR